MMQSRPKYFPEQYDSYESDIEFTEDKFTLTTRLDDLKLHGQTNNMQIFVHDNTIGNIKLEDGTITYNFDENTSQTTKNSAIALFLSDVITAEDEISSPSLSNLYSTLLSSNNTICVNDDDNEIAKLLASLGFTKETNSRHTITLDELKDRANEIKESRRRHNPAKILLSYLTTIVGIFCTAVGLNTLSDIRQTKDLIGGSIQLAIGLISLYFAFTSPWDKAGERLRHAQQPYTVPTADNDTQISDGTTVIPTAQPVEPRI